MTELSFGAPGFLVLAALMLPLAGWGISRERRRRRQALATYGDAMVLAHSSALPQARAWVAQQLFPTIAVALALVALARPQLGQRPANLVHAGRDVLVLLDLSRSMNAADDVTPRLTSAKRAVEEVLGRVPENRVGLIVFGESAFLQLPLTSNQGAFRRFLDAASTDDLGDPGTSLASALTAAAATFEHEGGRGYQSVLLVSDGESGSGDIGPALGRLRRAKVPVFSIGVGSTQGAPVPADSSEAPEKWHRDHIGRVVISRLEEGDLRRAARETNGVYGRWTPAGVEPLARELAHMDKRIISSQESLERIDRFQWPLGLAVLALFGGPLIGVLGRRKPG
ncbi:MAG TPA: VWA domain-containing protein [Gemmatimonadales bacterium]|jgi:Ca-activated chloride channel family protein|nr:VWA domain-containing protein [Gemmatimonadales bacterium]